MKSNIAHFEDLWCKGESVSNQLNSSPDNSPLLEELSLKINLYKTICLNVSMKDEEKQKTKEFIFGEILLSLCGLSYSDNVDVYKALATVIKYKSIDLYAKKD